MFNVSVQVEKLWLIITQFAVWLARLPRVGLRRLTETEELLDWHFVRMEADLYDALHSSWDKPEVKDIVGAIAAITRTKRNLGIGLLKHRGQESAWKIVNNHFRQAEKRCADLIRHEITSDKIQEYVRELEAARWAIESYLRTRPRRR